MDMVNDKILKRLIADTNFEEYDWCTYIVECLRKCKKKWKPKDPNSWWAGPISMLTLLYVDSTELPAMNTKAGVRAIQLWTKDILSRRQDYEVKNGGFGHGKLKAINVGAVDDFVDCIEKWVTMMAALRVKIKTHLGARLMEEPNNTVFVGLKSRYVEVLDDEPIWPREGLDSFAEGQLFNQGSPTGIAKTPSHGGGGGVNESCI
ncbi:hypothetical protein Hanom_Chr03g00241651 [Helianthus anomalus]